MANDEGNSNRKKLRQTAWFRLCFFEEYEPLSKKCLQKVQVRWNEGKATNTNRFQLGQEHELLQCAYRQLPWTGDVFLTFCILPHSQMMRGVKILLFGAKVECALTALAQ